MGDFNTRCGTPVPTGVIGVGSEGSMIGDVAAGVAQTASAAVWNTVNTAHYMPVVLPVLVTVYRMGLIVGTTASGNVDVGFYDLLGNRLVSSGLTAIGSSAAVMNINITDTPLTPGVYYIAAWCSTITTATFNRWSLDFAAARTGGQQMQASLASGLPATATFAAPSTFTPLVFASFTQGSIL